MTHQEITKTINEERIKRGWTICKLGAMSGVPRNSLPNILNNRTGMSVSTLHKLVKALNLTIVIK